MVQEEWSRKEGNGKKITEAREKLRRVYGRNVVKKRQCQNWFARFRDGDFSIKDAHRSDRPSKIDDNEMKALVQTNKHSMVRELATALKVSVGNVHGHLKSLGFVKKLDVWVPHELTEIHLTNRVRDQLIKREENVLEAYDHGRRKMNCLQQCQPKKKLK
ncbi:PREDICTED: histone-lysine N-methyltransferase SETMAR-like [Atta cephalotes]|uniref:Mos1 transposase HTH domain-containing protein n=1 Tax=Atta cephalotes TaxID=12957 RepID=A0A158NWW7_ATTCE|nr:PREDICTED: histone-lysine N-methyltransferase SETMAR-like [Atta cephalotes]